MDSRIQNSRINDLLIGQVSPAPRQPGRVQGKVDFASVLQDKLKVSGHAQTRLQSRNIELGESEWNRVLEGVDRAAAKGAKESLVFVDDAALVVSIKNRTVITAVDRQHLKENVFTNIDSAVIV
jgi:flagellar operon protein